jgi:hypothetical protein
MLLDLGFILVLTLASAAVGERLLALSQVSLKSQGDRLALAVPLGLGLLALGVFGLGQLGALTAPAIGLLLVPGIVLGGALVVREGRECRLRWSDPAWKITWPDSTIEALWGLGLVGTLLTALTPVTDGDALAYHLQLPKTFLMEGSLRFDPYLHESAYPMVTELLYAVALAWRGPVACRLIQWVLGASLGLATTALARPVLGDRSRWAGTIVLLVPAISNGMSAPLNDVALAAWGTSALLAWMAWLDAPDWRRAMLAGLQTGLALGVKYPALIWAGLLGGTMAFLALPRPRRATRATFGHVATFAGTALLIGGVWYLRAWWFTGNPVYPFFRDVFGGAGLEEVLGSGRRPLGLAPGGLLTALVPMTLNPSRFESRWHQIGPVFLVYLPLLLVARPPRRVWGLVGLGYAFFTLCLTMRQSPRFSLTALGPLAVGVAWVAAWAARRRKPLERSLLASLLLILAGESVWAVARARHGIGVVLGWETAEAYLSRREPTFDVARWIDRQLPPDARLIGQEHRGYYFPRPYISERRYRLKTGVGALEEPPESIIARYRADGFTHLLMSPPIPESSAQFDPLLTRRLEPWLARASPLFEREITDPDGVIRRYAIYDLHANGSRAALHESETRR